MEQKQGMTRRNFLKVGALAAVGTMASGLLAGCGNGRTDHVRKDKSGAGVGAEPEFMKAPAPIADSSIKETKEADVIVVGAGMSGLCAAASAAESGAKVIVIEKGPTINFRSFDYGAVNSKVQLSVGNQLNPLDVTREIMRWGGYKADQRVVKLFSEKSGMVNDWIVDKAQGLGCKVKSVWTKEDQMSPNATIPNIPTLSFVLEPPEGAAESTPKGMIGGNAVIAMAYTLKTTAEKLGAEIIYETPGVQLVRPNNEGRVTGVIAKNAAGEYIKFNARKGVILCSGDYGHDEEMLNYYIPCAKKVQKILYPNSFNTGDGQKMGLWVGAGIDEGPHAPMLFDNALLDPDGNPGGRMDAIPRQPWLAVNKNGERYANEDLPFAYISNAVRQQVGLTRWTIWDAKWPEEAPRFKQSACKKLQFHHRLNEFNDLVEKGVIVKADTLEELAQKAHLSLENLKASVERYNELARKGVDEDFGKDAVYLTTVEKAPFYAGHIGTSLLVTLGGLTINDKLQVLDKERKVIPGLYAAGNASGSFFATDYPIVVTGCSHGRAYTFGYLAGKSVVEEKA